MVARTGGGAVGSGGNFLRTLQIDADGHVLPEGHLDLQPGDQPIKLYVWLVQIKDEDEGGDAAAAGFQDIDGLSMSRSSWLTRNDVVYDGKFKPGIAVGLALAILKEDETGKRKARWWTDTIRLE